MKHLILYNKNDKAFSFRGLLQQTIIKRIVLLLLLIIVMLGAEAQIRAVGFGSWNDPNTWDAGVPTSHVLGKFNLAS